MLSGPLGAQKKIHDGAPTTRGRHNGSTSTLATNDGHLNGGARQAVPPDGDAEVAATTGPSTTATPLLQGKKDLQEQLLGGAQQGV